jgi:ABC-2 type transport system permease protein
MTGTLFQPRAYLALARTALTNSFGYRGTMLMYAIAKIVTALALFYLWQAIIAAGVSANGYQLNELKTYILLGLLTNMIMAYSSETRVSRKVLDGSIAMDLLKPLDFQATCFAEAVGMGLFEGLLGILITLGVALTYGGVQLSTNPITLVLLAISLLLGLITKFGIVYLTGLLCFWTESPLGVVWMRQAISNLFSGAIIPLAFFPDWLQNLAYWLPFQAIVHIPAQIALERHGSSTVALFLLVQLGWIIVLFGCGRLVWRLAIQRITIEGG